MDSKFLKIKLKIIWSDINLKIESANEGKVQDSRNI